MPQGPTGARPTHARFAARRRAFGTVAAVCALALTASACADPESGQPMTEAVVEAVEPSSFALYALSRGKGVPEDTWAALAEVEALLEDLQTGGTRLSVGRERIGLEGETRLCVTFADPRVADETFERVARLIQGVELINLVREPCTPGEGR